MPNRGLILLVPALAGLSLLGLYIGPVTLSDNGLGDASWRYVMDPPDGEEAGFPGAPRPLFRDFTGLKPLDTALAAYVAYFSALLDGDVPPHVALYGVWAFCQFVSLFVLLVLEGWRAGNRGKLVGWTTALVMLGQLVSMQFLYPLWVMLYLLTSPIAKSANGDLLLPSSTHDVGLLPLTSILVLIPLTLAMYPLPFVSARVHYTALALWQAYPLWHYAAHRALAALSRVVVGRLSVVVDVGAGLGGNNNNNNTMHIQQQRARYLARARPVYDVVFAAGVLGQLPLVLLLALGPRVLGPRVPAPLAPYAGVRLAAVFAPPPPWDPPRVVAETLRDGELAPLAHFFLQYDVYVGCGALLVWALSLHRAAVRRGPGSGAAGLGVRTVVWLGLGGVAAAVSGLLWERDWHVLRGGEEEEDAEGREKKRV